MCGLTVIVYCMLLPPESHRPHTLQTVDHRASGAGLARNSTLGAFGGAEKVKDVRPLHDKAFLQQCIRQVFEVGPPSTLQRLLGSMLLLPF